MAQLTLDFDAGVRENPIFKAFIRPQSQRTPNPAGEEHPFRAKSPAIYDLGKNAEMLKQDSKYEAMIDEYKASGSKVNLTRAPKVGRVRLGDIKIHPHIQRYLAKDHCTRIMTLGFFDPQMMGVATAIYTSEDEWYLCDKQHTLTCIIRFIQEGLLEDYDGDWEDYVVDVWYIETDDIGVGVRWFSHQNGYSQRPQDKFKTTQTAVVLADQYGSTVTDFVEIERKVAIAEKNDCYAVPTGKKYAEDRTFTHVEKFLKMTEEQNKACTNWCNTFFPDYKIDSHVFTMFTYLFTKYDLDEGMIPSEKLLEQLAGILQKVFGDMLAFKGDCDKAWKAFNKKLYKTETPGWKHEVVPTVLLQLYSDLGGEEYVPQYLLDSYNVVRRAKTYRVSDFLPESTMKELDKYLESEDKRAA